MKRLLGILALALCFAAPAHATPNFLGASGLLLAPDASVVGDRSVGGFYYGHEDFNAFGALFGPMDRLEIGVTVLDADDSFGGDTDVLFNGKFALLKENAVLPGLAVGVIDAFDQLDVDPSWYVVASKGLPNILPIVGGMRFHLGYGGGIYNDRLFAGAELQIGTPLDILPVTHPTFSFIAEYVDRDIDLGLRGRWKGLSATVAVFDFDTFGGGLSYVAQLK